MHILIIDDHSLFREGLKFLLPALDSLVTFDEAGSCAEAFSLLDKHHYDLILLDIQLPDRHGLEALVDIRESYATTPVVVISGDDSNSTIEKAIDNGAMGFISKYATQEELIEALHMVLDGEVYLPSRSSNKTSSPRRASSQHVEPAIHEILTPRQIDVLRHVIRGEPNKVIARELDLSAETVKKHISAVLSLLNVENRTQAVYFAARHGMKIN